MRELRSGREARTEVSADRVIRELAAIAFTDPAEVLEWSAGIQAKPPVELDESARRAVAAVESRTTPSGTNVRVRFHDKLRALELLGRHFGIFQGSDGVAAADIIQGIDRRSFEQLSRLLADGVPHELLEELAQGARDTRRLTELEEEQAAISRSRALLPQGSREGTRL